MRDLVILDYGQSLRKADLIACTSLDQIRAVIKFYAEANPSLPARNAGGVHGRR
jgi:hypothetical protein